MGSSMAQVFEVAREFGQMVDGCRSALWTAG